MVEIFQTNVKEVTDVNKILSELSALFPGYQINFDLEDCDKILRVEYSKINCIDIILAVNKTGFLCKQLN